MVGYVACDPSYRLDLQMLQQSFVINSLEIRGQQGWGGTLILGFSCLENLFRRVTGIWFHRGSGSWKPWCRCIRKLLIGSQRSTSRCRRNGITGQGVSSRNRRAGIDFDGSSRWTSKRSVLGFSRRSWTRRLVFTAGYVDPQNRGVLAS
jgi:hypothetical protein